MAIPRQIGWLVFFASALLVLAGLSMLALDKPNVVWSAVPGTQPLCPHCRSVVPMYAKRCPTCREEFDWTASPDEDSAWCTYCLREEQVKWLEARRKALGDDAAAQRVAEATGLSEEDARGWLASTKAGRCGWCGGRGSIGKDDCPVCFGEDDCIVCDGSLRVHRGSERAAREWEHMSTTWRSLPFSPTAIVDLRDVVRDDERRFVRHDAGNVEATLLLFWPDVPEHDAPPPAPPPPDGHRNLRAGGTRFDQVALAADKARERVRQIVAALAR